MVIKKNKNMNNSRRYKKSAIISLITSLIILIALNIIFSFLYVRIDLTQDKRNSLSETTIDMLKSLNEKVYIKVYLKGKNQPADYELFAKKTEDILQEFRRYSKNIYFEFIDPIDGKSQEETKSIFSEFYKKGLQPIPISKQDAAGFSTHYVVPGAMITYKIKEAPSTLVVSDPNGSDWLNYSIQELEYNLVSTIRQLVKPKVAKIGFTDGHGELDVWSTSWMMYQLQRFYSVERVTLNGKINSLRNIAIEDSVKQTIKDNGNKFDVLVIAQPTLPFSDMDKFIIDQHVMRGGKILWVIDATNASIDSLQSAQEFFAMERPLNLNTLFFKYGVRMNTNLVQDLSCLSVPIPSGYIGDKPQFKFFAFPYLVDAVNFSSHPIVRKLKNVKLDFTGTVDFVGNSGDLRKTVLMTTSERTKMVPTPSIVSLGVVKSKPNMEEYAFKYLPLAVLVEGEFTSAYDGILPIEFDTIKQFGFTRKSPETRQIFISDGDVIRNYFNSKTNQPYPAGYDLYTRTIYDNTDLLLNCVNYLCADDDLLQIRSKSFKIGTLNPQKVREESKFYAILNITIPLGIIAIMGFVMILIRKRSYARKRVK
ncbi:MAG: gliding motility-associated ABC transporter substrate-binding protein GldG [Bacteroidetes bacterium HGW-Bacteroidetes-19]|nr:MAG: gliding motility-associated ABC transporter substrate-binding protein GldG [Bacteroidetes bacterium HGW-Bacteroidetes-20]PKP27568.1 MAG: gliding motility-associated ABC transporter substrate-binding protein GldG [Bacteroidetes bacterium HGW-Bacteroidetes-19]